MATISKINNVNIADIERWDGKFIAQISHIDNIETGAFRFAATSSANFRIHDMDSPSAISILAINQDTITHSQSYTAGSIPNSTVVFWNLTGNVGQTSIYFIGFDASTVTSLNMAFSNDLEFLNTSKMINLQTLVLRSQPSLTALDLSQNTLLSFLDIGFIASSTGITDLANVVGIENTALQTLYADNCFLTGFGDLNQITTLQTIRIGSTRSSSIDISSLVNLTSFIAGDNRFTTLDLSNNINLQTLSMPSSSLLASVDLSNNINLIAVNFLDSNIAGGISGINSLTNLSSLALRGYQGDNIVLNSSNISALQLRNCDNMTNFSGYNVSTLTSFDIQDTSATSTVNVDLSNCVNLTNINLRTTNTTALVLPATLNSLTDFDVSINSSIHNATFSVANMTVCDNFLFNNSRFTDAQLDQFFIDIEANTTVVGTINVSNQVTGGTPTATSLTARTNLTTNGWTIIL